MSERLNSAGYALLLFALRSAQGIALPAPKETSYDGGGRRDEHGIFNNWRQAMSTKQPAEKPGPHHDHKGHTPGDLDEHGHRDTSVPAKKQTEEHHDHAGHTPGDKDQHGHQDTGGKKK